MRCANRDVAAAQENPATLTAGRIAADRAITPEAFVAWAIAAAAPAAAALAPALITISNQGL